MRERAEKKLKELHLNKSDQENNPSSVHSLCALSLHIGAGTGQCATQSAQVYRAKMLMFMNQLGLQD
jgi:hypothetical protein